MYSANTTDRKPKFWVALLQRKRHLLLSLGAVLTAVASLTVFTGVGPAAAATQNKSATCSNGDLAAVDDFTYTTTTSTPFLFGVESLLGRAIDKWDVVRFDKNGVRYESQGYVNSPKDDIDSRTVSWPSRSRSLGLYERFTIYYYPNDGVADCTVRITEP